MCKRKWIPSILVTLAVGTLTVALACGGGEGETVVVKEEVIREVPVERIVEKEVIREVIKEVPVEKTVVEQVMIEVAPSLLADNQDLRIAQISNTVGLHYSETTIESESVIQLLYDPYFLFNEETAQFEGWLATEWEFTDPTTFVMSVRDDVSFHDGEKFTMPAAIEVVRWLREDSDLDRYANLNFGGFETWEAVGDYTIELGRDSPNSNPLSGFTRGRFKPMSATQLAKLGWEAYSDDPVGMGPMQYVDWERENFVRLEKFQDYWAFDTAIETMSFHQVPETAVRVAGLQTGDFNIAYAVPVELIPRLLNDDFKTFTNRVQQTSTIYLNPRGTDPEMADKRVRQAMQYAVDLETIHGTILGGYALPVPAGQMGPAGTFGFNPAVKAYPYDPDKARALLAEAGFPDGFSVQGINTEHPDVAASRGPDGHAGLPGRRRSRSGHRVERPVAMAYRPAGRAARCRQRNRHELVRAVPDHDLPRQPSRLDRPYDQDQRGDRPSRAGGLATGSGGVHVRPGLESLRVPDTPGAGSSPIGR